MVSIFIIQAPAHSGSTFYNYKGTHSVILMAVPDPIMFYPGRCAGRRSGGVFSNSAFRQAMKTEQLSFPDMESISLNLH